MVPTCERSRLVAQYPGTGQLGWDEAPRGPWGARRVIVIDKAQDGRRRGDGTAKSALEGHSRGARGVTRSKIARAPWRKRAAGLRPVVNVRDRIRKKVATSSSYAEQSAGGDAAGVTVTMGEIANARYGIDETARRDHQSSCASCSSIASSQRTGPRAGVRDEPLHARSNSASEREFADMRVSR
jgi:hypothetical protein